MAVEVELKFPLSDRTLLERRLAKLQPSGAETTVQVDCYFAHPCRDFAATDEALRLRRAGELNYITYKGPKLDAATKTRRKIEIVLPNGRQTADEAAGLLEALGFTAVAEVTKRRASFTVHWQDREVGVSLDEVAHLGSFVELEIVSTEDDVAASRDCLTALADHLALTSGERRSYLELLFAGLVMPDWLGLVPI